MKLILQYDDGTETITYLDWKGIVPPPLPGDEIQQGSKVYRVTSRRYQIANNHLRVAVTYADALVLKLAAVPKKKATQAQDPSALALAHPWLPAIGSEVFIQTRRSKSKPLRCPVLKHGSRVSDLEDGDKMCEPCFWAWDDDVKMGPYFQHEETIDGHVLPGHWKRAKPSNDMEK